MIRTLKDKNFENKKRKKPIHQEKGERGIRTLDSSLFQTIPVFKTGAINHSAISPKDNFYFIFFVHRMEHIDIVHTIFMDIKINSNIY